MLIVFRKIKNLITIPALEKEIKRTKSEQFTREKAATMSKSALLALAWTEFNLEINPNMKREDIIERLLNELS